MVKKVLIIDDHPIFRQGLISLLRENPELQVCGEASDSESALKLLQQTSPDLVTLDLTLKIGSGFQLLKKIRHTNKKVRILVASMHDDLIYAERCISAGANGYINKEEASSKIMDALACVLNNDIYLSDRVTKHLALRKLDGHRGTDGSPESLLSNRELEVFMLIGKGYSTQRIAKELHLSTKTIDTHKEHIKKKLGANDNSELVRQAVAWDIESSFL